MLLDLLQGYLPSFDSVALLAVCAQFAPVNVSMTACACGAHVGEHRLGMTRSAAHSLMHPTQGITGLVVVEFRNIADRGPAA